MWCNKMYCGNAGSVVNRSVSYSGAERETSLETMCGPSSGTWEHWVLSGRLEEGGEPAEVVYRAPTVKGVKPLGLLLAR